MKQFLDTSWRSHNSTQFWCYLGNSINPRGSKVQSFQTILPTPNFNCQSQSRLSHLSFWRQYRSEVSMTPTLGLTDFLEKLTEVRETFYWLDHQLMVKGTSDGRDAEGQGCAERTWRCHDLSRWATLPTAICIHQPGSSLNPLLLGFKSSLLTIHTVGYIVGHWQLIWPLTPLTASLEASGLGLKVLTLYLRLVS